MRILSFTLITFLALTSSASIQVVKETQQKYQPSASECQLNDSCDLKIFRLVEQKKKVILPGTANKFAFWMTDVRAVYQTQDLTQIEKYAIVQQIKGCIYEATWDGKTEKKYLSVMRNHMGSYTRFQHTHWQIDNDYPGAVYTGYVFDDGSFNPFFLLNWNTDPNSLDADHSFYYGQKLPPHPVVFATDMPGPATLHDTLPSQPLQVQNTSLEYNTCLFKLSDLPKQTDGDGSNIDFNKAVKCFNWDHKFIYDFKTKKFTQPKSIDPVCLKPVTKSAKF